MDYNPTRLALITSDCDATRSPSIKWPYSPRIVRPAGPLLDADGSRPFDWWDVVIRATGWEFNRTMFGPVRVPRDSNSTYPTPGVSYVPCGPV